MGFFCYFVPQTRKLAGGHFLCPVSPPQNLFVPLRFSPWTLVTAFELQTLVESAMRRYACRNSPDTLKHRRHSDTSCKLEKLGTDRPKPISR
jgi:hypothetical protein